MGNSMGADPRQTTMDRIKYIVCTYCCCYVEDLELKYIEGKYEFQNLIGEGSTGKVYRCICKNSSTREQVTCKIMPDAKNAHDEIYLLHLLNSDGGNPGILRFIDYRTPESRHPQKSKNVYLVTEFCNGRDLRDMLIPRRHLPERQIAKTIKSLVETLRYCHLRRVIHRDVKPSSIFILYDENYSSWTTKLGNFDRAIRVKPGEMFVYGNVGSVGCSAPEMRSGRGYLYEADIWSAGVVLYILLCGRIPFNQSENESTSIDQILQQNTKPDVATGQWSSVSDSAKDLVLGMLEKRIWNRLSCNQILSHPWILTNTEIVSSASTRSRVVTSANKEKSNSKSKIDTASATTSESNKNELGSTSTAIRSEAALASSSLIDLSFPTIAESGSASLTNVDIASSSTAHTGAAYGSGDPV